MKKKNLLILVLTLFLSTIVLLTGCTKTNPLKNNPDTNATVVSNGGMAVLKGEYLYYVNGFQTYENLEKDKDNVWGKQVLGAIYRVKVSNDNVISHTDEGFLTKSEVVVPQIVGTENSNFYIFGDYIYYATPNMEKDKNGNLLNARSNICKIKIDGTDNKVLYTTDQTLTSTNWTMYDLDGTVYVVMLDGTKLVSINASASKPSTTTLTSSATSTALIKDDKYAKNDSTLNKTIDGVNNYIYYTRALTDDDKMGSTGNVLARVKINSSKEEIVAINGNTYTIQSIKNNCLYYTYTANGSSVTKYCRYELSSTAKFNESKEIEILNNSYQTTLVLDKNNDNYIGNDVLVVDSSNNIKLISIINNVKTQKQLYKSESGITSLGLYGSQFFFLEDSSIKYIDVTATNPTVCVVETNEKTLKTGVNVIFDYDGRNVYYYTSYTPANSSNENYYLNRTDTHASIQKSEFVGVFADSHTPEKPNDEDLVDGEPWIK